MVVSFNSDPNKKIGDRSTIRDSLFYYLQYPLHEAVKNGDLECLERLIKSDGGAKINSKDKVTLTTTINFN